MVSSAFGRSAFWDGEVANSPNCLLKPDQLKELRDEGWMIGSHGISHRNYKDLDAPALEVEAARSKAELERTLGSEVSGSPILTATIPAAKPPGRSRL